MYDVVVIGGGPAGLMAAGTAAEAGARVLLLEKMEKPARKLRITGKGRCNITNTKSHEDFFAKIRSGAEFSTPAFEAFDNKDVIEFLNAIGLPTAQERGDRIFPQSSRAQDVANALERWAKSHGATIRCDAKVDEIITQNGRVASVHLENNELIDCHSVIIATGGISYPITGSTGDGYEMAAALGHSIEPIRPSLVPLQTDESLEPLAGLALRNVAIRLLVDNKTAQERFGDVDFYAQSIAGATVIQVSRDAVDAIIERKTVHLEIDLKPALTTDKLVRRIERELADLSNATLKILLQKLTPSPLHKKIAYTIGIPLKTPTTRLTAHDVNRLASTLKSLSFRITDYRPFTEAIVTAGGVATDECDPQTMESMKIKNLYFAGEVLDIDADTGGYNIQLAFSTGRLAGMSAARAQIG